MTETKILRVMLNITVDSATDQQDIAKTIRNIIDNPDIIDVQVMSFDDYKITHYLNLLPAENTLPC